jgi:uncharacterized protein (DUF427 family)
MPDGNPAPGFRTKPDHSIVYEKVDGVMRVRLGGEVIAESADVIECREGSYPPAHYFPRGSVKPGVAVPTDHATHCPFKGDASYWTLSAGGTRVENGMWSYETPFDEAEPIRGRVAFYASKVEAVEKV